MQEGGWKSILEIRGMAGWQHHQQRRAEAGKTGCPWISIAL